jgi:hypothetical protein
VNPDVEIDELEEMIGEFATLLLKNNGFIYKGMETSKVDFILASPIHLLFWLNSFLDRRSEMERSSTRSLFRLSQHISRSSQQALLHPSRALPSENPTVVSRLPSQRYVLYTS